MDSPAPDTPPATSDGPAGPPRLEPRDRLLLALLWIPYGALVARFWFVTDDAFITFRYSKNLAAGLGARFNPGEHTPIEGYSNFLWMLLCALFERLGLNIEVWPNVVSILCGAALVGWFFRTLRVSLGIARLPAALGTLVLALHPPFAVWTTGGLAILPYALCLFLVFERLAIRPASLGGAAPVAAGLAATALSLLRVEGVAWALVLLVLAALTRALAREPWLKPVLTSLAILLVGYGAYQAWRYGYYGRPFPNTVYAKSGGLTPARLERGFDYVATQFLTQLTPFLALLAIPFALRRNRLAVGLSVAALSVGFPLYSILVSGDFMCMARFLVPGWSFVALLIAWMLADLARTHALLATAVGAGALALGLLPGFDVHLVPGAVFDDHHFRLNTPVKLRRSEYQQWRQQAVNGKRWAVMGRALQRWTRPEASIVCGGIGAVGYYSERFIHDRNGLVTFEPSMKHFAEDRPHSPGHDLRVPNRFFLKYEPDVLLFDLWDTAPGPNGDRLKSAANFIKRFGAWFRPLNEGELKDEYVPDFHPVPSWEHGGPGQYLVVWRRHQEGVSTGTEWGDLRARLDQFAVGADKKRRVMERGYPVPPWR